MSDSRASDYFAAEKITELIVTAHSIQRQIHSKMKVGGVLLVMANETNFRNVIIKSVKENFG